jgi:hypothetical protein
VQRQGHLKNTFIFLNTARRYAALSASRHYRQTKRGGSPLQKEKSNFYAERD